MNKAWYLNFYGIPKKHRKFKFITVPIVNEYGQSEVEIIRLSKIILDMVSIDYRKLQNITATLHKTSSVGQGDSEIISKTLLSEKSIKIEV